MIKKTLALLSILPLICCKSSIESTDYLGQTHPDSIPVIFAPAIVSVEGRLEHGISFTPDMKELAFGLLNEDDFSGAIYYSKKSDNNWSEPIVFEPLKDTSVFLPYFSPDGKSMLFAKSKPDTDNAITDIWMVHKNNGIWNHPEKINGPVSSSTRESTACMTLDNTLYFSSNRNGSGLADLYFSSLDTKGYSHVERIDTICSERDEESIFVSPDGDYIIFSRYATNENGPDLFISYQDSKRNWTAPRLLDAAINSPSWERRPFVSFDNKFLFFTKLTFNQPDLAESDIYWVSTQKIFKPFVFNPITEKTIKIGRETIVTIPSDYFKDLDNEKLKISIHNENVAWAKLDNEKMTLVMHPNEIGEFDLIFTAVDTFSNKTNDSVKIIVEQ